MLPTKTLVNSGYNPINSRHGLEFLIVNLLICLINLEFVAMNILNDLFALNWINVRYIVSHSESSLC